MAQAQRKPAPRRSDAISLLKADHDEVSKMFEQFQGTSRKQSDIRQKAALAEKICEALTIHAQIEEEIFYPACQETVEDAENLLAEAKVEHQSLKELIAKIEEAQPGTEEFDAEVTVLGEYVKHQARKVELQK
jgi:hemerythrin superfamily protein